VIKGVFMKTFLAIIFVLIILIAIGFTYAFFGIYNVAASNPKHGITEWFLSSTMDASVKRHSQGIIAPLINNPDMKAAGSGYYSSLCVDCHGGPKVKREIFAAGLNPNPPDLEGAISDWTNPQLFWIVKNGVKMTGMPSFEANFKDNQIWEIVSYLRTLSHSTTESSR
jgi:hypothetical protein